jgi:hypothetical protein
VTGRAIETDEYCPFCQMPRSEHDIAPGHLHWVWICENAPDGWRGVFYDRPVETTR